MAHEPQRPSDAWALEAFDRHLSPRAAATRRAYRTDLRQAAAWLEGAGATGPGDVTRLQLRGYLASLTTRGRARATVARTAASLRTYFSWLERSGALEANPAARLTASVGGSRLPP